jgi:hypothetical protein
MAFPFPFLTSVFASLGGEGFVPDLLSFVRNQPAPIAHGAGFRLGGARTGFPDFSRFPAHFWGILALFRASGRAGAPVAKTAKR